MNPIDDFFQENLKNREVTPSERANLLFLNKLEVKKKRKSVPYWYFALAASLFIVSLVGVYYYQLSDNSGVGLTALTPAKDHANGHNVLDEESVQKKQNMESIPNDGLGLKIYKVQESDVVINNQIIKPNLEITHGQVKMDAEETADKKLEAFFESENVTKMAIIEEARKDRLEETLIYLTPILALNQANPFKTNPRIIQNGQVVSSYVGDEYFADDKSLLTRVLDEVKHLKKGEKVDFNKLGFKPIEELALDREGFIVSETNQIKDRINWIKARLNNN